MAKFSKTAIKRLSEQLDVDPPFILICVEESIIDISEVDGALTIQNGSVLRLRRLQRLCATFDVDYHVALLLFHSNGT